MNFKNYKTESLVSFIVILAIICNFLYLTFDNYINDFPKVKEITNYVGFLSILGLMLLFMRIIDKYLWKKSFTNILIEIPDLNGRYEGIMTSSYIDPKTNQPTILDCIMEISQTASKIHVHTYIGKNGKQTSQSETICEELKKESNDFFTFYYSYGNISNLNVEFNDHKGTAYLSYFPDKKCLVGNYFNERKNNGEIRVYFKSEKLLGRYHEQV